MPSRFDDLREVRGDATTSKPKNHRLKARSSGLEANSEWPLMIVGTGIDIAEVQRIASAIERFGRRFLERVFTPDEIRYCESKANKAERYAGRFAAKEAAMKAIGTGWHHGVTWQDVEVKRIPGGRPTIAFHGKAAEFFRRLGAVHAHLSITHTKENAMAQVILEAEEN